MSVPRRRALWIAALLVASACFPSRMGFWPPADRLVELRPGVSSKADVEALLGVPLGHGEARFAPELVPREIWVYGFFDYSGRGTSFDQGLLLVFIDGDGRYDGHAWTTSGNTPKPTTGPRW